jgi:transcriptional regulator with XRE-family HTH domain
MNRKKIGEERPRLLDKYPVIDGGTVLFGARVKAAREKAGLTHEQVVRAMGKNNQAAYFLMRLEEGRADPQTGYLARLAVVLGVTLRDLYGAPKTELSPDGAEVAEAIAELDPEARGHFLGMLAALERSGK